MTPVNPRWLLLSALAWLGVWAFWLATTASFHPTTGLAVVVTTSLVAASAAAAYVNHLVLVPRFWATGRRWRYACWLAGTALALTAVALTVIRLAYTWQVGPDADPNGAVKHYLIDLFGMAVHLAGAAGVVWVARPHR